MDALNSSVFDATLVGLGVLVLCVLLRFPAAGRLVLRLLRPLVVRLTPEPVVDVEGLELYRAVRRERALRDAARLARLVADDAAMSAVRQLGNRLAYAQVRRDLAELDAVGAGASDPWSGLPVPTAAAPERWRAPAPYSPQVEVLELGGWR